jgi:hypothetical protein
MVTNGKRFVGLLLLVLAVTMPLGCGGNDRDDQSRGGTRIGGDYGVVVDHGVSVGGEHGVVVDHGVTVGGEHGVSVGHDRD